MIKTLLNAFNGMNTAINMQEKASYRISNLLTSGTSESKGNSENITTPVAQDNLCNSDIDIVSEIESSILAGVGFELNAATAKTAYDMLGSLLDIKG